MSRSARSRTTSARTRAHTVGSVRSDQIPEREHASNGSAPIGRSRQQDDSQPATPALFEIEPRTHPAVASAVRAVLNRYELGGNGSLPSLIAVTAALHGEGTTTISTALAEVLTIDVPASVVWVDLSGTVSNRRQRGKGAGAGRGTTRRRRRTATADSRAEQSRSKAALPSGDDSSEQEQAASEAAAGDRPSSEPRTRTQSAAEPPTGENADDVTDVADLPGLMDVLALDADLDDVLIEPPGNPHLRLLGAGGSVRGGEGIVSRSPQLARVLDDLADRFGYVVLDCPPVLVGTAGLAFARHAQAHLTVSRYGVTTCSQVAAVTEELRSIPCIGAVLNGYQTRTPRFIGRLFSE